LFVGKISLQVSFLDVFVPPFAPKTQSSSATKARKPSVYPKPEWISDHLKGPEVTLNASLHSVVFSRLISLYTRLLGESVFDALCHLPKQILTRKHITQIHPNDYQTQVILQIRVVQHISSFRLGQPTRIHCRVLPSEDPLDLVFFMKSKKRNFMSGSYPEGRIFWISGKLERFLDTYQINHPTKLRGPSEEQIEPVYPLAAGITSLKLSRLINLLLNNLTAMPEWHDPKYTYPSFCESFRLLHNAKSDKELTPDSKAFQRLLHDELLAHQLALHLARQDLLSNEGIPLKTNSFLAEKIVKSLPFSLTPGQEKALHEIRHDMEKGRPMLRLIQGDVGCGKTLVASLALADTVDNGYQGAFLVPTDLLAQQHAITLTELFEPHGINVGLLTGKVTGKKRKVILEGLAKGEIHILIGTHAVIQETVTFKNLALAVIDEQHRFGVDQRSKLVQKGGAPHLLSMTATPIPRTLQMTLLGDLDITTITDKPPGRQTIHTSMHNLSKINDIMQKLKDTLSLTNKAYWVCPLIEESATSDLTAAKERYESFKKIMGDRVAIVHGKMRPQEKEDVMMAFKNGDVQLLIATTVIEVGVDVRTANIMVIEHAERFGLAQLHQLRGRVGRSSAQAHCLLLYEKLTEIAKRRLHAMRESNDGFYLSEVDLEVRGGGDVLGLKQSGLPSFRFYPEERADIFANILRLADQDARHYAAQFENLPLEKREALELLLSIYKKDSPERFKRSG